ncbi:hypothetical protein F5Y15DRAFT_412851 [Xylariaceae sp. FL0016]|nr:hypothetical protein F5Y15DRAFT_412851 [Xylariaceae sp. FL0016]
MSHRPRSRSSGTPPHARAGVQKQEQRREELMAQLYGKQPQTPTDELAARVHKMKLERARGEAMAATMAHVRRPVDEDPSLAPPRDGDILEESEVKYENGVATWYEKKRVLINGHYANITFQRSRVLEMGEPGNVEKKKGKRRGSKASRDEEPGALKKEEVETNPVPLHRGNAVETRDELLQDPLIPRLRRTKKGLGECSRQLSVAASSDTQDEEDDDDGYASDATVRYDGRKLKKYFTPSEESLNKDLWIREAERDDKGKTLRSIKYPISRD